MHKRKYGLCPESAACLLWCAEITMQIGHSDAVVPLLCDRPFCQAEVVTYINGWSLIGRDIYTKLRDPARDLQLGGLPDIGVTHWGGSCLKMCSGHTVKVKVILYSEVNKQF